MFIREFVSFLSEGTKENFFTRILIDLLQENLIIDRKSKLDVARRILDNYEFKDITKWVKVRISNSKVLGKISLNDFRKELKKLPSFYNFLESESNLLSDGNTVAKQEIKENIIKELYEYVVHGRKISNAVLAYSHIDELVHSGLSSAVHGAYSVAADESHEVYGRFFKQIFNTVIIEPESKGGQAFPDLLLKNRKSPKEVPEKLRGFFGGNDNIYIEAKSTKDPLGLVPKSRSMANFNQKFGKFTVNNLNKKRRDVLKFFGIDVGEGPAKKRDATYLYFATFSGNKVVFKKLKSVWMGKGFFKEGRNGILYDLGNNPILRFRTVNDGKTIEIKLFSDEIFDSSESYYKSMFSGFGRVAGKTSQKRHEVESVEYKLTNLLREVKNGKN